MVKVTPLVVRVMMILAKRNDDDDDGGGRILGLQNGNGSSPVYDV